jgi:phospholipase C
VHVFSSKGSLTGIKPYRLWLALIIIMVFASSAAAQPCPQSTTDPSVTICTPTNGVTVTSPVRVVAGTNDSEPVTLMQIYVDGVKVDQVSGSSIDRTVPMSAGSRRLTVQAMDSSSRIFKQTIFINVSSGSTAPCPQSSVDPSVTICTPTNGATVTSPVRVVAGTNDSQPVTLMQIYVDGAKVFQAPGNQLDTTVPMTPGTRRLTVQAQDSSARVFKQTIFVTVASTGGGGLENIRHIIFFLQENRSHDNYFGRMGQYRRDRGFNDPYDELPLSVAYKDKAGHLVSPFHFQTVCHENLSPAWNETHYSVHGGLMDRFMQTTLASTIDPDGTRAMGYYDWTDLPYYYELAFRFGSSDRFFSSLMGPTIPNRMYMFAATSFGHIRPDNAPTGTFWQQPTIFDKLDQAGVSWKYYFQDNSVYLAQWSTWQRSSSKVLNISNWYTDVLNEATLPKVIFIERAGVIGLDEHPNNNIQKGAANTKKILDALMNSPSWPSSAFVLTFDEGGGLFDHVPPATLEKPDSIAPMLRTGDQPGDFNQTGIRVPLIVISPWSKPNFVSHRTRELTSILRLIQVRFGVPNLTARDAAADDMTEFFDFTSPQWLTPPALPAQPTTGACNFNLEKAPGH